MYVGAAPGRLSPEAEKRLEGADQSLPVQLPKTGFIVLSGDAVHFQDNWTHRRVPSMNFNRDQTLASLQKIAALLEERKAQLWINHDKPQSDRLKYAPAFYEATTCRRP